MPELGVISESHYFQPFEFVNERSPHLTRKSRSDLGTEKIEEQSPSNYEPHAAPNEIAHEGIHQVS